MDNTTAPRWYIEKVGAPAGSGVHLFVAIDGQVVVHASTAWRQRHTPNRFFRTNAGIGSGRQLQKCRRIHREIAPPPPGRGYNSAQEVARYAGVALTGPVVVDPLLIVIFWDFSVIPPHRWVQPLLWVTAFLIDYLTKRSYYNHTSLLFLSHHNDVFSP